MEGLAQDHQTDRRPRLFGKSWNSAATVSAITVATDQSFDVDTEVLIMGRGRIVRTVFDDEKSLRIDVVKLESCDVVHAQTGEVVEIRPV